MKSLLSLVEKKSLTYRHERSLEGSLPSIIIYDIKKINELFEIKETFLGIDGPSDNFFVKKNVSTDPERGEPGDDLQQEDLEIGFKSLHEEEGER